MLGGNPARCAASWMICGARRSKALYRSATPPQAGTQAAAQRSSSRAVAVAASAAPRPRPPAYSSGAIQLEVQSSRSAKRARAQERYR
eukprot:4961132-Alexandrium_andersonii.AAC.1